MKFFRLYVENGKKNELEKIPNFSTETTIVRSIFCCWTSVYTWQIDHDRKYTSAKFQGEIRTFHTIDVMLRYDRRYFFQDLVFFSKFSYGTSFYFEVPEL